MHAGGHVTDFIEKNGAAAGALQQAFFAAASVGEGPVFVAEKLALQESIGKGSAIDLQQWHGGARTGVVNCSGEHAFAGTTLTLDQNRGVVGFGGLASHLQHLDGGSDCE